MVSIIFIALGSMVIGGVIGFSAAAVCVASKMKDCSECSKEDGHSHMAKVRCPIVNERGG